MPTTVPGTAKTSIEVNSMSRLPGKRLRTTRKAMIMPKMPARGVASRESVTELRSGAPPSEKT